jgi:hypothetical protein
MKAPLPKSRQPGAAVKGKVRKERTPDFRTALWSEETALTEPGAKGMHTSLRLLVLCSKQLERLRDFFLALGIALAAERHGNGPLHYAADLDRDKMLVRLTALLHDLGHGPFSHAGEELLPEQGGGQGKYQHEHYSAAIIRDKLRDVIEDHPLNRIYRFRVRDITALLEGSGEAGHTLFWRDLISGQLDADRIDYLLRDSLHAGVDYGRFDWRRLLHTVAAAPGPEGSGLRLGVREGGWHAAEALVLARYFMFTQVYFHKTRVAFDHHLRQALAELLPGRQFPKPEGADRDECLRWDDWRVLGLLSEGKGGEHGRRLAARDHYREIFHTPETPTAQDLAELGSVLALRCKSGWLEFPAIGLAILRDDRLQWLCETTLARRECLWANGGFFFDIDTSAQLVLALLMEQGLNPDLG